MSCRGAGVAGSGLPRWTKSAVVVYVLVVCVLVVYVLVVYVLVVYVLVVNEC